MRPNELAAWQLLQTVSETLHRETEREFGTTGLSASEFTVLAHLVAAGGSARPVTCARSIGWDSSRLAHQASRLEKRGLVSRRAEPQADGRAVLISITDEGRAAHRSAVGPHLRAAQRLFADALTPEQLDGLEQALSALARHLDIDTNGAS